MEGSGQNKEPAAAAAATTSDEVESAERATAANDDAAGSSARSYECIFCKRGFTTAQALGGHMNIHRKDRVRTAKSGPSSSAPSKNVNYGYYHPYPNHRRSTSVSSAAHETVPYAAAYLPGPIMSATNRDRVRGSSDDSPGRLRELSLFGEDLHLGLSMPGEEEHGTGGADEGEEEGKLDLELRLGNNKQ